MTSFTHPRSRTLPLLSIALILILMTAYVAAGNAAVGYYDTYRDLHYASLIATGEAWPLAGPLIYNTIHVGPVWWYVLGGAAALGGSLTAAHFVALLLAALKFPLAWHLGRRLLGDRFGLLALIATAMPGWSLISVGANTHSSVVETTVLLGALSSLRYRERPGAGRAALLGLMAALMLHAHPTALPVALACVVSAGLRAPGSRTGVLHLFATLGGGIAIVLPYFWQLAQSGFADFLALEGYAESTLGSPFWSRLVPLFDGVAVYGPEYVWRFWLGLDENVVTSALAVHWLMLALASIGLALALRNHGDARDRIALVALTCLLAQVVFALVLRPITPFWMVYAALPPLAFAIACGLDALLDYRPRAAAAAIVLGSVVWIGSSVLALFGITRHPDTIWVEVIGPGGQGLMNITERNRERRLVTIPRLGVRGLESLGSSDCKPLVAYGHLAHLIDSSFGVGRRRHCGSLRNVYLGGTPRPGVNQRIGLTEHAWRALAATPAQCEYGLGYASPAAVWTASDSLEIVSPDVYPPRHPTLTPEVFVVKGITLGEQRVIVANRLDGYYPMRLLDVRAGGRALRPAYEDNVLTAFRAPSGSTGAIKWTLTVEGPRAAIDVFVVDANALAVAPNAAR